MSFTRSVELAVDTGSDRLGEVASVIGDNKQDISVSIPNGTTDYALGWDWGALKLKQICIVVDKDCTMKINSTGAPTDTVDLKAATPFFWIKDSGMREPFVGTAGAVTNAYITVPDTDPDMACNFQARVLVDL